MSQSRPATDVDRMGALLDGRHACVRIVTDEEEHALGVVRDAAMGAVRDVRQWSAVRGVSDGLIQGSPEPQTENAAAGLFWFARDAVARSRPAVYVTLDLAGHLADERTLRALRELIQAMEGTGSTLVMIDSREDLPAVLHSYTTRLDLAPPGEEEIRELVFKTLREAHRDRAVTLDITRSQMEAVVRNLRGLSRRQVRRLVMDAIADDRTFSAGDLDDILTRKRRLVGAAGLLEFVQAPTDLEQIGGLGRLKGWLRDRERALTDEARVFGIDPPRGVLMLGVQGAGKSLCAKAIATAWRRPLLRMDPGVLYDRYIGESERRLREALRQAEMMAPVVLWIDEIEKAFASAASHSIDGGLSQRMFGTLLNWMQEHREPVFLAATANNIESLPPELLRKGRFDEIFFVDLPGREAREEIFRIHLRRRGRDPKAFDMAALTAASEGYSGAEIEQAVVAALHAAFSGGRPVDTARVLEALRTSPPLSVTMAERIADLRDWARERCVPAE